MMYVFLITCLCSVATTNSQTIPLERNNQPPHLDFIWALRETMSDTACIDRIINIINKEFNDVLKKQRELNNEIKALKNKPLDTKSLDRLLAMEEEWQALENQKTQIVNKYSKQALECSSVYQKSKDALASVKEEAEEPIDTATTARKRCTSAASEAGHKIIETTKTTLTTAERKADDLVNKASTAAQKTASAATDAGHKVVEKGKSTLETAKEDTKNLAHRAAETTKNAAHAVGDASHKVVEKGKETLTKAKDGAKDLAHKAAETTKNVAANLCDAGSKVLEKGKNALGKAEDKVDRAKEKVDKAKEETRKS